MIFFFSFVLSDRMEQFPVQSVRRSHEECIVDSISPNGTML